MLSVCIITRDEREKLQRCLQSLQDYALEVVVVDTGSEDGTQAWLQALQAEPMGQFQLTYGEFPWCNDFSKARNYAISLAAHDSIFVLDSDEILLKMDLPQLLAQMEANRGRIGRIALRDQQSLKGGETARKARIARVFDRRDCCYAGRVHEQIVLRGRQEADTPDRYYQTEVEIHHDGYVGDRAEQEAKAARNIALLEAERAETGEDPYVLYHLGKNYYRLKAYAKAVECFANALTFDLDPRLEYVVDMVETYGYALLNSGHARVALGLESIFGTFGHTAEFRLLMGHIYLNNCRFDRAVELFLMAAECPHAATAGANSFLAYYNAGVVHEVQGNRQEALRLYRLAGDYAPARARIAALEAGLASRT